MGTLDKVKGLVENPPKEYRSAPFWGWNDRLQKENLGEQIEGFKKAGMGGFFIHSREGLETEYLSTEWMEDVKFCVDKARENDLELWIYDEEDVYKRQMQSHCEDKIEEIDRQTGAVVNELKLQDIIKCKYENLVDWAHINTVSYQPETDTILLSVRNLESVIKVNWTTKEIQWILCDPRFWEGTDYEKYVLKADGDFIYQFQQHTAYQIDTDLDSDDQTVEITMFDNHFLWRRKKDIDYYDKTEESYLLVYSVNEAEGTVKQIKKIPTVWSKITSAAIYEADSNHFFGMCGHVANAENGWKGMTYEFDYDTEKVLNQYCLKKTFYRAEEMRIDYNDLASPMELDENYIKGELWQPVKTWKWLWNKKPDQVLPADTLTYNITGKVLYIGTYDHQISQIIFKGAKNTYVYDTTEVRLHMETFLDFYENIPVPLQGMNADNYEIYVMYQDGFYDTQQTFAIN